MAREALALNRLVTVELLKTLLPQHQSLLYSTDVTHLVANEKILLLNQTSRI